MRIICLVAAVAWILNGLLSSNWVYAAPDCGKCAQIAGDVFGIKQQYQQHQMLYSKNELFLKQMGSDPSKSIKIKSNMSVLWVRMEALKNLLSSAEGALVAGGCDQCRK